jgi:hypothetical protein
MEDKTVEKFRQALRQRRWWDAREELRRRDHPNSLVDEFITALIQLDNRDTFYLVTYELLPHCTTEQLDRVLARATREGWWEMAGKMLKVGGSETQRARTIEEACDRASDKHFKMFILSHCTHEYLQSKLSQFVFRGVWMTAGLVLAKGVGDTHQWVIVEASKRAEDTDFKNHILPHCTDDQLESVLTHLVSRPLCKSLGLVLERGVSDIQHQYIIVKTSKKAEDQDFIDHILSHCTVDHLESALPHLVSRRLWKSVVLVFERGSVSTNVSVGSF